MLRLAKFGAFSFNPEPAATACLKGTVAVGSGLNEPTQPRAVYFGLRKATV